MIADVPIREIVSPATLEEAADVMRASAARGTSVAFMGGGTELGFGNPPERVDTLLKTEKLTRVVEYAPSDQVVTVESGLTLGALQTILAAEKQRLALDAPRPELATVGGLLATNGYGPLRTRFGMLRDLIVGISVIRADGMLVHGGGKVVKNVAGFDLPKLMVGSFGTLGLIASATFRLHPLPERRERSVAIARSLHDVRNLCRALLDRRLEPSVVVAFAEAEGYALHVVFEGFGAGVESQIARLRELTRDVLGAEVRTEDLRISTPPAFTPSLDADILAPLRAAYQESRAVLYPTAGATFIGGFPCDADRFVAALARARAGAEAAGGNLVVLECGDPALRERFDVFGTLPSAFPIMRRLKERFDPERRLGPGRFVGGL